MRRIKYILLFLVSLELSQAKGQMLVSSYRYVVSGGGGSYDADAQTDISAIEATGVTLSDASKNAIDRFVRNSKGTGPENTSGTNYWTGDKAYYIFVGGTAGSHAINCRAPGTNNLTFIGTWTHNSSYVQPGGTNASYANTGIAINSLTTLSQHLSIYTISASASGNRWEMGGDAGFYSVQVATQNPTLSGTARGVHGDVGTSVSSNGLGYYLTTRRAAADMELYKNGSSIATSSSSSSQSTGGATQTIYIGAINSMGSAIVATDKRIIFVSIGSGRTDVQAAEWNTIVERLEDDLGRGIQ